MADENAAERLGGELPLESAYQPPVFTGAPVGPGRWFTLYARSGEQELGVCWTSDAGGLGYMPTTEAGIVRTPEFVLAFSRAAGVGTAASDVFDYWASLAGLGLSAGPVHQGDLDAITQ